tara:strand:+ start:210 stop:659 length:450 start_codon:yes stop_codon:yes gene_type:complete
MIKFTLFNNKQNTIVLLIIILFLLNKINIKKNGMNQEGGQVEARRNSANERDYKDRERKFDESVRAFKGLNPLNWGYAWLLLFSMFCFLIYAYIATDFNSPPNPNSGVMPDTDDNMRTVDTNVGSDERSMIFLSNRRSPSSSSSPFEVD